MIKELAGFGEMICKEKYKEWNHVALKEEPISIDLVIESDGSFSKFEMFEKKQTITEAITAKKGKARLLVDKAEEVLCYGGASSKKKHELFLEKLAQYKDVVELMSVFAFYQENKVNGIDKAVKAFELQVVEKMRKGNIVFRIKNKRLHEEYSVLTAVIKKYEAAAQTLLAKSQKRCSVCGKADFPVEDTPHGMIKNMKSIGGQTSGSALISYNAPAFESYRLNGNENSAICANCAKSYVEGVNWLLSSGYEITVKTEKGKEEKRFRYTNRKRLGSDTALIFWTRKNSKLPEIDQLEAPSPDDVGRMIESVTLGKVNDSRYVDPDQFYACALSGSAARIAVRDWIETSLPDFRKSIVQWFKDIAIGSYDKNVKDVQTQYIGLYSLAKSCQKRQQDGKCDDDDVTPSRIAVYLWKAALKNISPPFWILTRVLQRARVDKYGVSSDRAALIKLVLNRNNKGKEGGCMVTENGVQGEAPAAYICGQIFAKMESMQYLASSGDRNAGIRERYFTHAMTAPSAAFGRLFDLYGKHYKKVKNEKPGLAVVIDRELQDLCKGVDIARFPAAFSLEERGYFAIGYYHQRQQDFCKKSKNNENKEGK